MSPTPRSLWAFRSTVALGLAAVAYSSHIGARYLLWLSLVAMLLCIVVLQGFGQVSRREGAAAAHDPISEAMNGPNGLRVRIGLVLLAALLGLLAFGVLEPSNIAEWFIRAKMSPNTFTRNFPSYATPGAVI